MVLLFLKNVEIGRKNSAVTRNHRLAALRVLFSYFATKDIFNMGEYQKITMIPFKRAPRPMMAYLEVDEIHAILGAINQKTAIGLRDYAIIYLMYNTGARVQEICDLNLSSIRFEKPALITIKGKGQKIRQVPLWDDTCSLLRNYLDADTEVRPQQDSLFLNRSGIRIGRFGVRYILKKYVNIAEKKCVKLSGKIVGPHTIRHTTAMHLLQSGVDLSVIKSWLGHVNIGTTHGYIEIDMEMKRKTLEKVRLKSKKSGVSTFIKKNNDVITWLESL